jgi:hypothetical protein
MYKSRKIQFMASRRGIQRNSLRFFDFAAVSPVRRCSRKNYNDISSAISLIIMWYVYGAKTLPASVPRCLVRQGDYTNDHEFLVRAFTRRWNNKTAISS